MFVRWKTDTNGTLRRYEIHFLPLHFLCASAYSCILKIHGPDIMSNSCVQ